ncbi:PstS family phosphate ABC transporter substrate-binding protein [Mucilaginibacter psychrotolerans]|uniref:Phosphate ABC transporter substrate-binding protein n=1 Tax=Mucilaginibacter psychrotolerans TaxID=1524096 RepID=A0A4Y8S429_9SPHI|nr:substrate-binding domain-containing protein [Mucilaginibacter psychrotolerans]TFF33682.1 phosphate ABC transporter substrate-binding protein [Mucilaginibacter psychrotolerans]
MKSKYFLLLIGALLILVFQGCTENKKDKKEVILDGFTSGTLAFAADESFSPIVGEEEYVFRALYPEAKPEIKYAPESETINALINDKVRVAIISRELDTTEVGILRRRALPPDVNKFAVDAVALIVNQASNDTLTSVKEVIGMLNGKAKTDKNIVFDNPNSSLVRYLKQISGNKDFTNKNIYALKSNKEVIKYVSTHPNAIGITGFAWLNDPDKDYAEDVSKVKIVGVRDESSKTAPKQYFKPSQTTLVQHTYPLSRSLYIVDCTGRKGLGAGFASFLASERGQRIILKSGLLPESIPSREINIKH